VDESYTLYLGGEQSGSIVGGATIEVSSYLFYFFVFISIHRKPLKINK
jgi:hypothetical protein